MPDPHIIWFITEEKIRTHGTYTQGIPDCIDCVKTLWENISELVLSLSTFQCGSNDKSGTGPITTHGY